jgi:hypothetical protein
MIKPRRSSSRQPIRPSGYWLVLALITISYAICALQTSANPSVIALLVQLVTVGATLWVAEVGATLRRIGWIVLAVAGLAAATVALIGTSGQVLDILLTIAAATAYLIAPGVIIAQQARKNQVDGQTLLAAIGAYIMVGMFFTFLYTLIALVSAVPTFGEGTTDSLTSQLFFSFTTLTTTGYGNLVPVGAVVQSVAIAEAVTGQLFLVIAVARVVSAWQPPNRRSE